MRLNDLKALYETLKDPGTDFRSLPFWGWNDRMQPEELRRQIADFRSKGFGGAFVHSREGLETPYLSEEWMEDVALSAKACESEGLRLWIYDEDKWPSGSAGGLVSAADPDLYAAKGLTLEILPNDGSEAGAGDGARLIAQSAARVEGRRLTALGEGDTRLVLRQETSRPSEWYNGHAPSDCLSPKAMARFLRLTHERYDALFEGRLREHVGGFFTDEPNCCDFFSAFTPGRPWLPWTEDFAGQFALRRGYDPTDRLFDLFFDRPGCEKTRHDYWRTVTELFSERCLKPMYDWCEARGLTLTGHMLYENDLGYNIRVCGAAMPHYRYLHAPGVDILGEQTREYLTVKQAVSVARQMGRERVLSESYGCTGWDLGFEGQKWLGDWQFVMGVTHRCQHLALYSVTGCRKRDYPPVFNYQNTWWKHARALEDYFARLSACACTGAVQREVLVLHPISSLWTKCASAPDEDFSNIEMNMGWKDAHIVALNREGDDTNRLAEALMRAHWDFDFADETILAEAGAVEGDAIRVGEGRYRVVVVPPVCSLFESTCALLEAFAEAGGALVVMGSAPALLEGVPDERPGRLFRRSEAHPAADIPALLRRLEELLPGALRVRSRLGMEDEDILTQFRRAGDDALLIAVNHSRTQQREAQFCVPVVGRVIAYDPWSHERRVLPCTPDPWGEGGMRFTDALDPVGSKVYFIEAHEAPLVAPPVWRYAHPHRADRVFAMLGPVAPFRRAQPNALTLDRCRWSLNGGPLSPETDVWRAQRDLRRALGLRQVYYNGAPQRYTWIHDAPEASPVPFALEFRFRAAVVPETPCRLAVEKPEGLRLTCNGAPCERAEGWFLDRGIGLFRLPALLEGENVLLLCGETTPQRELEDVFLLGDFAVDAGGALTAEPAALRFGDWGLQGYPHYAGSMVYRFRVPRRPEGQRVVLRLGEHAAAVAEVRVNGQSAGLLFGAGYREADLTRLLISEENDVQIEVFGTPRNLLGPLHAAYDGCARISWEDFRTEGPLYTPDRVLVPCGLMGQIALRLEAEEENEPCP